MRSDGEWLLRDRMGFPWHQGDPAVCEHGPAALALQPAVDSEPRQVRAGSLSLFVLGYRTGLDEKYGVMDLVCGKFVNMEE